MAESVPFSSPGHPRLHEGGRPARQPALAAGTGRRAGGGVRGPGGGRRLPDATAEALATLASADARIRPLFSHWLASGHRGGAGPRAGRGRHRPGQRPPASAADDPHHDRTLAPGLTVVEAFKRHRGEADLGGGLPAAVLSAIRPRLGHRPGRTDRLQAPGPQRHRDAEGHPERRRFFRGLVAWAGYPSARLPFDVPPRVVVPAAGPWSGWCATPWTV
ncbi:protein of unknown function [Denitratisoma oestradiolicum]|uniref:Uncharacterized protein n=1 Tax=Denitratisoma oestradiolicum TaxID=311182 RepID=A0A6S6YHI1_9PROT|nr:protein of unknown function [Denitratisoma oestradiolicum]